MAALNFPTSPSIGDTYSANGKTWQWDGTSWKAANLTTADLVGTTPAGSIAALNVQDALDELDSEKQPLDGDLSAIAALAGTSGLLKKTAADTWTLDTSAYLTSAVTSVSGTAPIVSSGGNTPAISISAATTLAAGSMSAADKSKLDGIASGATANVGTVTSVSGTGTVSGLTLSGTVTTSGSLTLGGTLAVTASNFASQTANTFLAAPNGAAGTPTFRAIVAADVPTLNQNTTGSSASCTGNAATATSAGNITGGNQTGSYEVTSGQYTRFGHANQQDANDGKIGAGLFSAGLNIVGTQTVAAGGRVITLYGTLKDNSGAVYYYAGGALGTPSSGNFTVGTFSWPNFNQNTTGYATYLNSAASSADQDNITTRVNSGFWQTSTATTAEGWPETSNGWTHLISCTHSNAANYYALQLAARFDTQNLYYRSTNGSGTTGWSRILHSNNYTEFSPTLTGTGASGSWGISVTGSSASCTGNAATATLASYCNNGGQDNVAHDYKVRVIRNNNSSANNDGMYVGYGNSNSGLTRIYGGGSTANFSYMDSTGVFKLQSAVSYVYESGTWGISITGSSASCTGNAATATQATNATSVNGTAGLCGYSVSGQTVAYTGAGGPYPQAQGNGAAMMSFHRPSLYGVNLGLDTDNVLKIGGWSMGAVSYPILHSGNASSYSTFLAKGTSVASTSGTSIDFTGIPSGAKRVTVIFSGVSTTGAVDMLVQLGVGTTPTTTGYGGASVFAYSPSGVVSSTSAAGMPIYNNLAGYLFTGRIKLFNLTGNTWVMSGHFIQHSGTSNANVVSGATIALGGALGMVRMTTTTGTPTFDAGNINIMYEY